MGKTYQKGDLLAVQVQRVVDGDTVRVRRAGFWQLLFPGDPIVVRLYAIDAPESGQKFGAEATGALRRLLRSGGLMLEVCDYDRYGRLVGLLYHRSAGRDSSVNRQMVALGWAHAYTRYGGSELGIVEVERQAKKQRAGLWQSRRRQEVPGDWRRRQRADSAFRRQMKFRMALLAGALFAMAVCGWWVWTR